MRGNHNARLLSAARDFRKDVSERVNLNLGCASLRLSNDQTSDFIFIPGWSMRSRKSLKKFGKMMHERPHLMLPSVQSSLIAFPKELQNGKYHVIGWN
jgi:hypothetical protein